MKLPPERRNSASIRRRTLFAVRIRGKTFIHPAGVRFFVPVQKFLLFGEEFRVILPERFGPVRNVENQSFFGHIEEVASFPDGWAFP